MKTRAAVAYAAGKPLEVATVELDGPRDGEVLGTLPSDLIPDLLRVDERCGAYVAEESGHLAAFGVAPRLSLVKGYVRIEGTSRRAPAA